MQTILVVDDEPTKIKLLYNILQGEYQIRVATSGSEALERVLVEPKPDIILLDVMMPEMDGFTVCKKIKSQDSTSSIPVIFVSAKMIQKMKPTVLS